MRWGTWGLALPGFAPLQGQTHRAEVFLVPHQGPPWVVPPAWLCISTPPPPLLLEEQAQCLHCSSHTSCSSTLPAVGGMGGIRGGQARPLTLLSCRISTRTAPACPGCSLWLLQNSKGKGLFQLLLFRSEKNPYFIPKSGGKKEHCYFLPIPPLALFCSAWYLS